MANFALVALYGPSSSTKVEDYLNDYAETAKIQVEAIESFDLTEKSKRAYNLFVNGEYDKAKELLKELGEPM